MTEKVWAPIILKEAEKYIFQKLNKLPEGVHGFNFERHEIEAHLANILVDAPRGSIIGALNRFLREDNSNFSIERVKRGFYKAYSPDAPVLLSDNILSSSIEYLEDKIIGASTYDETGLTESDVAAIAGIYQAIKILKATVKEIKEMEEVN